MPSDIRQRFSQRPVIRALKGLFAALVLFYLALIVINLPWFDESLDPELQASLETGVMPAPETNAWFALWGLGAADGVDTLETGQLIVKRHDEHVAATGSHSLEPEDFTEILGNGDENYKSQDSIWLDSFDSCTARTAYGCLKNLTDQLPGITFSQRLETIIDRYNHMLQLPRFRERYMDSHLDNLPDYNIAMRAGDLQLARLSLEGSTAFLEQLTLDNAFWRRVLADENTLVAKMVSVAVLWRNLQFVSEFMLNRELDDSEKRQINSILTSFTADELDISEVWRFEQRPAMFESSRNSAGEDLNLVARLLMQKNATRNISWRYIWEPLTKLSHLAPDELYELVESSAAEDTMVMDCCRPDIAELTAFSPRTLYNPVGKLLVRYSANPTMDGISDYPERVFDLQGIMHLAQLQFALKTGSESINALRQRPEYANPHTLQPMDYDAQERVLSFECRGLGSYCGIKL